MRSGLKIAAVLAVSLSGRVVGDERPVILQWFETPWQDIERRVPDFFLAGYGAVWLPPPSLASMDSAGFDPFDRFDLGSPESPTAYGTEAFFDAMVGELHYANGLVFIDTIMNHNGARDGSAGFQEAGGWPGFWMNPEDPLRDKLPTDDWGDFHNGTSEGYYQSEDPNGARYDLFRGDLVGLVDIAQESNHQFIRQPVVEGDPLNIPAGTVFNRPDPANARFYPDMDLGGTTFWNPGTARNPGAEQWTLYPFNLDDPLAGDPVPDNTTGMLMRWTQWMIDVHRVDGYRLDAAKHIPSWFWDRFWDTSVHQRRVTPDGRLVTPFSFVESVESNSFTFSEYVRKDGFADRDALDLNGAGDLRDLINGAGFASWAPLDDANFGHIDGIDDGFQNGSLGVNHVFSHDNGSTGDGSSQPPLPTDRQMGLFTQAYVLMRPGPAVIYHNGRAINRGGGFWPREGLPIALGWNPQQQVLDERLTRLVQIHNEYARGFFFPLNQTDPVNQSKDDVLIFERAGSGLGGTEGNVLVALNDRQDSGSDTRNVQTSFAPGTRLHELTGNAADPLVDPAGTIPEVLVVDSNRRVTVRVPRNRSSAGEHNRGYVIYGPAVPEGTLELVGVSGELPADPINERDSRQRLNPIPIAAGDTLTIRLTTTQADPLDPNTDDDALFRIDQGFEDWNGNGQVDVSFLNEVVPGYERFADVYEPLFGSPGPEGRYEQTIDLTRLDEGTHYLSVKAFRHRESDEAPLVREWRAVFHVDRLPPAIEVVDVDQALHSFQHEYRILAQDRTTNRVHVMWDLPDGVDPIDEADFLNQAPQYDRFEWRWTVGTGGHGWHRLTVVAFEETGNVSVNDWQVFVDMCDADVDDSGTLDANDFFAYLDLFAGGNPGADFTGDGVIDADDFFEFLDQFAAGCP